MIPKLSTLTREQKNRMVAEACGVKPELVCWVAKNPVEDAGCGDFKTRTECQEWIDAAPEGYFYKQYIPHEIVRYPDFCGDLNAIVEAIVEWAKDCEEKQVLFGDRIDDLLNNPFCDWSQRDFQVANATAEQRVDAFLLATGRAGV